MVRENDPHQFQTHARQVLFWRFLGYIFDENGVHLSESIGNSRYSFGLGSMQLSFCGQLLPRLHYKPLNIFGTPNGTYEYENFRGKLIDFR